MKEEKLEQLRKIFEEEVRNLVVINRDFKNKFGVTNQMELQKFIKNKANQLIYEVKIRINNK